MEIVGSAKDVVLIVSYLVLFVAAASVLVALYNTMNERRREIAIMRSLGARRLQKPERTVRRFTSRPRCGVPRFINFASQF